MSRPITAAFSTIEAYDKVRRGERRVRASYSFDHDTAYGGGLVGSEDKRRSRLREYLDGVEARYKVKSIVLVECGRQRWPLVRYRGRYDQLASLLIGEFGHAAREVDGLIEVAATC